eukprot:6187628-Pleurochrysis_carterae.AAC.3
MNVSPQRENRGLDIKIPPPITSKPLGLRVSNGQPHASTVPQGVNHLGLVESDEDEDFMALMNNDKRKSTPPGSTSPTMATGSSSNGGNAGFLPSSPLRTEPD